MSETQNLTTLTLLEATVLKKFIDQVNAWQIEYGEKANTIEITYYPEDDGIEIVNNEPNNGVLKRNRATLFRTHLEAWGGQQIKDLQGWNNEKSVTAFAVSFKDNRYSVRCTTADNASTVVTTSEQGDQQ